MLDTVIELSVRFFALPPRALFLKYVKPPPSDHVYRGPKEPHLHINSAGFPPFPASGHPPPFRFAFLSDSRPQMTQYFSNFPRSALRVLQFFKMSAICLHSALTFFLREKFLFGSLIPPLDKYAFPFLSRPLGIPS